MVHKAEREVLRTAELVASWKDPNLFADPPDELQGKMVERARIQARSELYQLRQAVADLEVVRRVAEREET